MSATTLKSNALTVIVRNAPTTGRRHEFSVRIARGHLSVPAQFKELVSDVGVESAEDFIELIDTFAYAVADAFGWTIDELRIAREHLVSTLHGYVNQQLLEGHAPVARAYGARRPPDVPSGVSTTRETTRTRAAATPSRDAHSKAAVQRSKRPNRGVRSR